MLGQGSVVQECGIRVVGGVGRDVVLLGVVQVGVVLPGVVRVGVVQVGVEDVEEGGVEEDGHEEAEVDGEADDEADEVLRSRGTPIVQIRPTCDQTWRCANRRPNSSWVLKSNRNKSLSHIPFVSCQSQILRSSHHFGKITH